MELTKEFNAFSRKASAFSFLMEKFVDRYGVETFKMSLAVPGYPTITEATSGCPEVSMKNLMARHLARTAEVKLTPRKKLLIVR